MLILASQSPRRREILSNAGFAFAVRSPGVEEVHRAGESPEEYVERMARSKALAAAQDGDEWVLAADTTVVCNGRILEKPLDKADARRMLRDLSGRDHAVLTGICLRHQGWAWSAVESTRVWFAPLEEKDIEEYAASGEPMDKAGGYAIQGLASKFIYRIEGCYFNVVGLPVARFRSLCVEAGYNFRRG
jgi:septum formation protein